jgi:hypothetical protein
MSVQRPAAVPAVLIAVLIVVAACGGGAASPGAASQPGGGATPGAATPNGESTDEPTDGPDGGGGNVNVPPVLITAFTKGTFHAEVTGDTTATLDLTIGMGLSAEGSTILNYGNAGDEQQASVIISPELIGVTASVGTFSIAGSTSDANHCDAAITQSDATRLAGTFDCRRLVTFNSATSSNVTTDIRGTFEASP